MLSARGRLPAAGDYAGSPSCHLRALPQADEGGEVIRDLFISLAVMKELEKQRMYTLELSINILPRLPNQLLGSHWRTRASHADKWRKLIADEVALHGGPDRPLKRAKLTCIRKSTRRPDYDGLVGSFKSLVDSLVRAKVLADDTHEVIGVPTYDHERVGPKCGGVLIKVEEITEEER